MKKVVYVLKQLGITIGLSIIGAPVILAVLGYLVCCPVDVLDKEITLLNCWPLVAYCGFAIWFICITACKDFDSKKV